MLEKLFEEGYKKCYIIVPLQCKSLNSVQKSPIKNENLTILSSSGCLHLLFGWNPYCITRLFLDNVFHFLVELFWCVSLDNRSEIFPKLVLKLVGALVQFASLKIQRLKELQRVLKVAAPALQSFACSSLTRSPCIWAEKQVQRQGSRASGKP